MGSSESTSPSKTVNTVRPAGSRVTRNSVPREAARAWGVSIEKFAGPVAGKEIHRARFQVEGRASN